MKPFKIIFALFIPILGMVSANAQNCPGNKIRISLGAKGHHCSCQKKCIDASEVATYQAAGWRIGGDCPQFNCGNPGWRSMDADVSFETSFTDLYPNPSSGLTTIFFLLEEAQQVSFKVYDLSGRMITTITEQESGKGENQIIWNTTNIKAGIYFVRMESGTYSAMKKVSVIN